MYTFTGKWFKVENCAVFDGSDTHEYEFVNVLEYREDNPHNHGRWCEEFCTYCGRPLKNHYFVVQDPECVEIAYLGADCVKKIKRNGAV